MAMGTYKLLRLMCFGATGLIGSLVAPMLFLMGFPLLGLFAFSLIVGGVLALIGFILTGSNPWVKAVQGDSLIVIDVNSTGVGKFYSATVKNNPFGGIDLNIDYGNAQYETRAYDRKVTHRLQSPLKILMQPWKIFKKPETIAGTSIYEEAKEKAREEEEEKISFSMPKKDYDQVAWHYSYLTVLYYNSETGMFLTKLDMREQEKQMQAEYLSLNEWRELKELNKTMRNFTRSTFDLIGQKFGGVFSSDYVKIVMIIMVVIIFVVGGIMAFPQLSAAILPAIGSATQSTQNLVTPIAVP